MEFPFEESSSLNPASGKGESEVENWISASQKISPRPRDESREISRDFPTAVCGVSATHAVRISCDSCERSFIRSTVETAGRLPPTTSPPLPSVCIGKQFYAAPRAILIKDNGRARSNCKRAVSESERVV